MREGFRAVGSREFGLPRWRYDEGRGRYREGRPNLRACGRGEGRWFLAR